MEVGVKVYGEHPLTGEQRHTSTAYLTFVAMDSVGRPTDIPEVYPETDEEQRWHEKAQARRKARLAEARRGEE